MKVSYVLFLLIKGFYLKTIIGFFITNIEHFGHVDVVLDREHVDFQKKMRVSLALNMCALTIIILRCNDKLN